MPLDTRVSLGACVSSSQTSDPSGSGEPSRKRGVGPRSPGVSCTSCRMRLVCGAGSLGAFAEQEGACEEGGRPGPPLPSRGSSDLSENSPGHQSALPLSRLSPQRCL